MTDWQSPWAILMTQADGVSVVHETVFENKMGYVKDLRKMGAKIEVFKPDIPNPEQVYNFNLNDDKEEYAHAIRIHGPTKLHDAVMTMLDLRAGAAVVLAALCANGQSIVHGLHLVDRGYEKFEERLQHLGAKIERIDE